MSVLGSAWGTNTIEQYGGLGNNVMDTTGGRSDDVIVMYGGPNNDTMVYDVTGGADMVTINGGAGVDTLTINKNQQNFTLKDIDGNALFSTGAGGTTITISNIQHVTVIGDDSSTIIYQWP